MDRFIGMAVFVKVVESASFAAAARHFSMSPALVSKHIQRLEERLGVRLLNRTTRRVNATEVGQDYYQRCLRILSDVDAAEAAAGDLEAAPRGQLRVTASVSFGTHQLAPAIADFLLAYPHVSIDLSLDDPYVDLLERRFDLAIRFGHLPDSSLIARKLSTITLILCAAPAYLEKRDAPRTPRDLTAHDCLVYTYAAPNKVWSFADRNGKEDIVHVAGRYQASSGDALLPLALRGAGVVLLPDFLVGDELKAGRLVRLLADYSAQETPIYAVYPQGRYLSSKTRVFIDFLAARFGHGVEAKSGGVDRDENAPAASNLQALT